ncbi:MAG: FkbM family methyltransferase [Planctomycetota bacterium]|nr:FkbM family methyltransferase [Planctomycetota bacterium]
MELSSELVHNRIGQQLNWVALCVKSFYRRKERARVLQLAEFIPPHAVVFDIGANAGSFAKEFCRIHDKSCQVYCFEPVAYTHSILSLVMRYYSNSVVEKLALTERNGALDISIPVKSSGRMGVALSHFGDETRRDFVRESVSTMRLDDYVRDNGVERLDFIKCDVEGAELLVLQGATATIEKYKPTIYCELENDYTQRLGYDAGEAFSFLVDRGYRAYVNVEGKGFQSIGAYDHPADYLFRMD